MAAQYFPNIFVILLIGFLDIPYPKTPNRDFTWLTEVLSISPSPTLIQNTHRFC